MELLSLEVDTATSFFLDFEETILIPLGDIQIGSQGCDIPRLRKHIAWAEGLRAQGKKVHYVGMGDYHDVASPSNQRLIYRLREKSYESLNIMMDAGMKRELKQLERVLAPTRGHWVGLLRGHHIYPFSDGSTTDSRLAEYLGCPYLGTSAILHLIFKTPNSKSKAVCKIWLHHGEGMGTTLEAAIRKLRTNVVPYWFANLYLIGHFHQKTTAPVPWVDTRVDRNGNVTWAGTTRYLVSTGSFLKGFMAGNRNAAGYPEGDYAEKAMYPPNVLGGPVIFIRPRRDKHHSNIDINVSI